MQLTPVMWTRISPVATFDTGDFSVSGGSVSSTQVMQNFNNILGNATQIDTGFIVLEHDLFQQTVELATGYIIPGALAFQPKLDIKPVITCMNLPMSDAFIETNDNKTNPLPITGKFGIVPLRRLFLFICLQPPLLRLCRQVLLAPQRPLVVPRRLRTVELSQT